MEFDKTAYDDPASETVDQTKEYYDDEYGAFDQSS